MVFDNNDELGIDSYREDVRNVISANEIKVKIIRFSEDKNKNLQGDFLGVKSDIYKNPENFININIMSQAPEGDTLQREGYEGRGDIEYNCFVPYDIEINKKDIIEFIADYGYNIKKGNKFRVVFKDFGLCQGQYCYKNFNIIRI